MEGAGGFDVETVYCFGAVGEGVVRCVLSGVDGLQR